MRIGRINWRSLDKERSCTTCIHRSSNDIVGEVDGVVKNDDVTVIRIAMSPESANVAINSARRSYTNVVACSKAMSGALTCPAMFLFGVRLYLGLITHIPNISFISYLQTHNEQ